jgi:site-specific DNA recombinase
VSAGTEKAVLYARVSSKEQEREGFSIPAQCKLLRSYADRHNYGIVAEFIDVETAKQSGRTNFTEMIRFFEEHDNVKILLCEKTDRLYRNFADYVTIDKLGVTLVFVKEGSVLNKHSRSHEKFIHGIKVLMAKNYIDNLSEETRKGLIEKAEQGSFPGTAPLGYRHNKEEKTIEIDEDRAPIIKWLFEQYATGTSAIRQLETEAAWRGLTTRKGKKVSRASIALLLKNPFYTGEFRWAGKIYHGKHEPLITKTFYDRVQTVFACGNSTRANSRDFTYKGLLRCGHCGSTITAEIKKDRYVYYHCTFDKGNCGGQYVREEELERQFQRIFDGFRFANVVVDWVRDGLRQSQKEKAAFQNNSITRLNARHAKLQNRIDQIYLDKLDGEIEDAFYRRNISPWLKEQNDILEKMRRHQTANENYIEQGIKLLELTQRASTLFSDRTVAEKRELIRFIMPDSILEAGTVIPTFKPPFDIIHRIATDARMHEPTFAAQSFYADTALANIPDSAQIPSSTRTVLLPGLDSNFLVLMPKDC